MVNDNRNDEQAFDGRANFPVDDNIEQLLENHDKRILESSLLSIVLFCWSKYGPDSAPTIEYIKNLNSFSPSDSKKESDKDKHWRSIINSVGYYYFDVEFFCDF